MDPFPDNLNSSFGTANKLIYQAGVDYESKPIVLFCAASLPDPTHFNYDQLLDLILLKLDHFCDNDYTCVMFVGGAKNKPSWSWLIQAYRRLNYKYKKNLKNLYIVHPAPWFQMLFNVMNRIISPKFARKVTWVKTLSQLASFVPLAHMNIPSAVYDHNLNFESHILTEMPIGSPNLNPKVFGISLNELMGTNGEKGIPPMIKQCMEFILANGLDEEGIFRRSPSSQHLKQAKKQFNEDKIVDLNEYGIHVAAVLIKIFLRELPSPIIPSTLYDQIKDLPSPAEPIQNGNTIQLIINELTLPTQILLNYICKNLNQIGNNSNINKMTFTNLAIVFSPNLVRSDNPILDVSLCSADEKSVGYVLKTCIENPDLVFEKVKTGGFAPPKPPRSNMN